MARIGVISISDGRDYVHGGIVGFIRTVEDRPVAELTAAGHTVVRGRELPGITLHEFSRAG